MYQANILRYDHFYYITFNIPRVINGKGLNMFRGDAENVILNFFMLNWIKRIKMYEELMAVVWNPKNFEKFKYLDPDTFGENEN